MTAAHTLTCPSLQCSDSLLREDLLPPSCLMDPTILSVALYVDASLVAPKLFQTFHIVLALWDGVSGQGKKDLCSFLFILTKLAQVDREIRGQGELSLKQGSRSLFLQRKERPAQLTLTAGPACLAPLSMFLFPAFS